MPRTRSVHSPQPKSKFSGCSRGEAELWADNEPNKTNSATIDRISGKQRELTLACARKMSWHDHELAQSRASNHWASGGSLVSFGRALVDHEGKVHVTVVKNFLRKQLMFKARFDQQFVAGGA